MGWNTGSTMLEEIVAAVEERFDAEENHEELVSLYERLIEIFEDRDADTLSECEGVSEALDEALWNKGILEDN